MREDIDSTLKDKMTAEAQRLGLPLNKDGVDVVVTNFREIGNTWRKMTFDLNRAGIINCVMNVQFDTNKSYELYIEYNIMKSPNIDYIKGVKGKVDIGKIVTRRKVELMNNLNYQGLMTHGYKILNIRSRKQVEIEEKRKPKTNTAFQVISGTGVGKWYTSDAKDCSVSSLCVEKAQESNDREPILKICDIKTKLARTQKILNVIIMFN